MDSSESSPELPPLSKIWDLLSEAHKRQQSSPSFDISPNLEAATVALAEEITKLQAIYFDPSVDQRIKDQFGLYTDRLEAPDFMSHFNRTVGLAVNKFKKDSNKLTFPILHLEILIDQCQDILTKLINDRALYNDLAGRRFQLALEFHEFHRFDSLHGEEIAKGLYRHQVEREYAEYAAEVSNVDCLKMALKTLEDAQEAAFPYDKKAETSTYRSFLSWLSNAPYFRSTSPPIDYTVNWKLHPYYGKKHDIAHAMTYDLSQIETVFRALVHNAQISQTKAALSSATNRAEAHRVYWSWLLENLKLRIERIIISKELNGIKKASTTADGGALNFPEAMDQIRIRAERNITKVLSRLEAISDGAKLLFGYDRLVPDRSDGYDYLDLLWDWLQQISEFVLQRNRAEANTIVMISIQALKNDVWNAGKSSGVWRIPLDEEVLGVREAVRLRGMSVYPVTNEKDTLWKATVRPPVETWYNLNGVRVTHSASTKNPASTKKLVFSRVAPWNPVRSGDVFGVNLLHNASPFGLWNVTLAGISPFDITPSILTDVLIELHLAYIPDGTEVR